MDTHARSVATDSGGPPPGDAVELNEGRRRPLTADGAAFLESLRARRQMDPVYGTHTFNPDETSEERDERIQRQLAGLRRFEELSAQMTEEEQQVWSDVFESLARSRRGHDSVDEQSRAS